MPTLHSRDLEFLDSWNPRTCWDLTLRGCSRFLVRIPVVPVKKARHDTSTMCHCVTGQVLTHLPNFPAVL